MLISRAGLTRDLTDAEIDLAAHGQRGGRA